MPAPHAFMARMPEPTREVIESEAGRGSFEAFFHDQYERLGRALYLLTDDVSMADELAQEAMVRIYERWDRVRGMESPTGYLYRTAMNLHRSALRRAARGLRQLLERKEDPLERVDDRDELDRLLARLPIGQRQALLLTEWMGMSAEDAGRVLGIRAVSVRVRVSRAKASLRGRADDA